MFTTKVNASGTYSQNWSKYNKAQVSEKQDFLMLLYQLCAGIDQPPQCQGRPSLSLRDIVFSVVYKVYSTCSSRRFISILQEAYYAGYIGHVPHFNALSTYLMQEEMAWLLTRLVEISSLPLVEHETEFAVDSTGLSTDRYARWVDEKEIIHQKREWHKLHIMCARRSKIIPAVVVTPSKDADSPHFQTLFEITSRNFRMLQVAADGAYYSRKNVLQVTRVGGVPYFLIPSPSLPSDGYKASACNMVLYLYAKDRAGFFKNYYKRNNVETAFSMIRACLGTSLRSTSRVAQYNEAICKVICHNLRVLCRAMHEEDLSPNFESVSSYVARIEEATHALAETLAGGRIIFPKRKRDITAEGLELFRTGGKTSKTEKKIYSPQSISQKEEMRQNIRVKNRTTSKDSITERGPQEEQLVLFER
ncbi:MAG: transposase [Pyrinomonadaceae bacterium]